MSVDQCRLCLKKGLMKSIFIKQENSMISTKIMCLAKLEIHQEDGLPSTICDNCLSKLNSCLQFIHMCEVSDLKLRAAVKRSFQQEVSQKAEFDNEDNTLEHADKMVNIEVKLKCIMSDYEDIKLTSKAVKGSSSQNFKNKSSKFNDEMKRKKQQCSTCGKILSSPWRLKTHLRIHSGEKPFSCLYCKKNFTVDGNLKVHLRTHTGERPLCCNICGESFAQSAALAVHKRKHSGQTPYKCEICLRSFRTIAHWQYHTRSHTGEKKYECDSCGRAFIARSDLQKHIVTHSSDKPHVCTVCGIGLKRAYHLRRHVKHMHNDFKQFQCFECPITIINKSEYEKHKKMHMDTKITSEKHIT